MSNKYFLIDWYGAPSAIRLHLYRRITGHTIDALPGYTAIHFHPDTGQTKWRSPASHPYLGFFIQLWGQPLHTIHWSEIRG